MSNFSVLFQINVKILEKYEKHCFNYEQILSAHNFILVKEKLISQFYVDKAKLFQLATFQILENYENIVLIMNRLYQLTIVFW